MLGSYRSRESYSLCSAWRTCMVRFSRPGQMEVSNCLIKDIWETVRHLQWRSRRYLHKVSQTSLRLLLRRETHNGKLPDWQGPGGQLREKRHFSCYWVVEDLITWKYYLRRYERIWRLIDEWTPASWTRHLYVLTPRQHHGSLSNFQRRW